jgi:hypothetical protein
MEVDGPNIILRSNRKRRVLGSPAKTGKVDTDGFKGQRTHESNCKATNKHLSSDLLRLDVVGWKELLHPHNDIRRKNKRRQLGEELQRRRTFEGVSKHGELLFRKRESFLTEAYTSCAFLGLNDMVMAIDCNGTMDVVKIGDSPNKRFAVSPKAKNRMPTSNSNHFDLSKFLPVDGLSSLFLEPLSGGDTVALGTRDELFLLDVERSSTLSPSFSSILVPIRNAPPNLQAWRIPTPKRHFYRDRRNPHLTLHRIAETRLKDTGYVCSSDASELCSIQEGMGDASNPNPSRIPNQIRFVPHIQPSNASCWSVREMYRGSSSVIQVAHVDSDYDAFSMQFLDRRSQCRPTIFVDSTSKDSPGLVEEHITAITCVSDICLATAHISCPNFGLTKARDFFDRDLAYSGQGMETCVKIWDLRMMSSSHSMKSASFVCLPSFPQQDAVLLEPVEKIPSYMTPKCKSTMSKSIRESASDASSPGSGGSDFVITSLESVGGSDDMGRSNNGSTNMGSLVATVQSRSRPGMVDHHKLDLGTREIIHTVSQVSNNLGSHPVYAISSSQDYLVCKVTNDKSFTLDIHDLAQRNNVSRIFRNAKRKKVLVDQSPSYCLEPDIVDRYGTRSILSCLAMNQNGTSIVAGTSDGDLYVWR